MNRVSGKGGTVFAVGDVFSFARLPLYGSEDGWSWVSPAGLGCWTGDMLFERSEDGELWEPIEPEELYPHIGRVVFPRSLSGSRVRVKGKCRPTALIGWGSAWHIFIETEVNASPSLSAPVGNTSVKVLSSSVTVDGIISPPMEKAFVCLPFQKGVYVGFGELRQIDAGVKIGFDSQGVTYEPCK